MYYTHFPSLQPLVSALCSDTSNTHLISSIASDINTPTLPIYKCLWSNADALWGEV